MRDNKHSESNFNEIIQESEDAVKLYDESIYSGNVPKDRLRFIAIAAVNNLISLSSALYSIGSDVERVKQYIVHAIDIFEKGFIWILGQTEFETISNLISLATLTDIDLNDFKRITKIIERDKIKDKLLDSLIKYKQPDWQGNSSSFIQKEPYAAISKALDESNADNGIKLLQNYLSPNVWYAGHSDAGWHDSHKNKDVNVYCGYWSWEAAALVKAKGWDDEKLKNTDYYPYDAVHW